MTDTDRWAALRELARRATPGPWVLATGNSWRRYVSEHPDHWGTVCEPVVQRRDGHPDLFFRNGGQDGPDARWLEVAHPSAIADLLAERDRLAADLAEARGDEETLAREIGELRTSIDQVHAGFVAENARLRAALVLAREAIASMPASLGYEYTHLRAIDAALRGDVA